MPIKEQQPNDGYLPSHGYRVAFVYGLGKTRFRRFFVVEDDLELSAILQAVLEKWRVFLHPSPRKLVERHWNSPVRVLGGAGTGKTVAAMLRAKRPAQNVFTEKNDRILFATFTRNLAADIRENLTKICPHEALARIEAVNLDKGVSDFLKQDGSMKPKTWDLKLFA